MSERLTRAEVDSPLGKGHMIRYRLAAGFAEPGDVVLDAACGIGYGREIFTRFPVKYVGVDLFAEGADVIADLQSWEPDFEFDIGVSFETIEHLDDYLPLIDTLKKARKWIIASVPVVPTVHMNPYHKQDFAPQELVSYIADENWEYYQYLGQPTELSEIYVFKRIS